MNTISNMSQKVRKTGATQAARLAAFWYGRQGDEFAQKAIIIALIVIFCIPGIIAVGSAILNSLNSSAAGI